jgi:hypothetical protein
LFVWHVFYFIFVEIIKTLYSILSYFLACNYIKARFYVKHILIIIKERNDQEKNNKHNQTQGGTNTIKMINVADRCFDRFDWNIRSIQTIMIDLIDLFEMIEIYWNLIPIKGNFCNDVFGQ